MNKVTKAATIRRWVLVNTFLTLLTLGFLLAIGGNTKTIIFSISAPFFMAITGTYLVDNLLRYFECMTSVKDSESDEIDKQQL